MAIESAPVNEFDEYRKVRLERKIDQIRTQALIEQPADKIYSVEVQGKLLRYHRWTHGNSNRWSRFLKAREEAKLKDNFTDEERIEFRAIQMELLETAIIDKDLWRNFLQDPANQQDIDAIWLRMMFDSMMTKQFSEDLSDFLSSDYGYVYGFFWFIIQGKLPHEIGENPDSSVHAVNLWLSHWAGKVIHK